MHEAPSVIASKAGREDSREGSFSIN